ncbi:MAG: choice-of-anchor D domain-containing protein, partial [Xanthomonadales bacterium]|nr:choice-of-anchor D domain-containing protein [Xanthomonadales bacterium]
GDAGDPYPGTSNNTLYDDTSNPNSKANTGASTGIAVSNISASMATMTADLQPATGPVGDHVRYDEDGFEISWGLGQTLWIGSRVLNDTGLTSLEGIDTYIPDLGGATLDISFYEGMAGGTPTNLIYSEIGIAATTGWNRVIFQTPQDFPDAVERGIVVKIVTDGIDPPEFSLGVDDKRTEGVCSGRSYIDLDGNPPYDELCANTPFDGDLNLVALFAEGVAPGPNAIAIVPETTGPTNADSVAFDVTFDTEVVNFNDADDLVIDHTGTAHGGVSITGAGAAYTATVTGISGDGSFTLAVDTTSDVQNTLGTPLESSVTSDAVIIDNTPPGIEISPPSVETTTSGPVSYTVSYTGANVVTLIEADIMLNQTGDADGSVAVSGAGVSSRTVTISDITGNGTLGISIAAGTASDTAGNVAPAAGPSETFVVDNPPPAPEFDSTPPPGSELAFGEVELGATSPELSVTVDNLGTADLTLACDITGANADQFDLVACPTPVAPAGSVQLSLTCSPDSTGEKAASLDVTTNDENETNVSYQLTCTGVESSENPILDHGFEDDDALEM